MKKIFFLALAVSCTEVAINDMSELASLPELQSETLTIEEALKELRDFNESIYGNTDVKSGDRVAEIAVCKIPTTKSTCGEEILAYVVNYEDDKGFAVINADPMSIPIVARVESGYMDSKKLNNKIWNLVSDCQTKSGNSEDGNVDSSSTEEFIYEIIANSLASTPRNSTNTRAYSVGEWNEVFKYGPLVTVKWNQTYPFNMRMEPDSNWTTHSYNYYRGLPPVGCANVALGQILVTLKQPEKAPGVDKTYNWMEFNTISCYTNLSDYLPGLPSYPFDTNPILRSKVNNLADFLHKLSLLSESDTNADGTHTLTYKTRDVMKSLNSTYFANAEILAYETDSTALVNCIRAGKPVFCRGDMITSSTKSTDNQKKEGHAWVIDGYTKRERSYSGNGWTGMQASYFYHINWGYSGKFDGYYYTGVFDMAQRENYDENIDTNPNTYNGSDAYTLNISFINY